MKTYVYFSIFKKNKLNKSLKKRNKTPSPEIITGSDILLD